MLCDHCHYDTRVIDSRYDATRCVIRRRRECLRCNRRTTTYELSRGILCDPRAMRRLRKFLESTLTQEATHADRH